MNFRKYWKTEYTLTFFAIFAIFILLLPTTIQNTRQAALISKWNEKYNHINYMFSVINAHDDEDIIKSLKNARTSEEKNELMMLLLQPYLRISQSNNHPRRYRTKYMNNSRLEKNDLYYFDAYYYTNDKTIVGIKDITQTSHDEPIFMLMFDMNGKLPPNSWGKDVFGINVFYDGKIEPFGRKYNLDELKTDCSEKGTGVNCSYYYIIGGGFDE